MSPSLIAIDLVAQGVSPGKGGQAGTLFRLPRLLPASSLLPRFGVAGAVGGLVAAAMVGGLPAEATLAQANGFDLGCAAGFGLVNITSSSTQSSLGAGNNSPNSIIGGSTVSVPSTCTVTSTPLAVPGNGNVLVGGSANINAGNATANQIYKSSSATVSGGSGTSITTINNAWTTQARTDALNVATYISGINATHCTSLTACNYNGNFNLSGALNIGGALPLTGGINYYDVTNVGSNVDLNFLGSAREYFVFNMPGSLSTNQDWTIQGDVDPSKIIFNFAQPNSSLTLTGADVFGTFLLTGGGTATLQRSGNSNPATITGSLIVINNGAALTFASSNGGSSNTRVNGVINGRPFNPTDLRRTPVPGPLPILGGAAAFGWSRKLRRRLKHSQRLRVGPSAQPVGVPISADDNG